MGREHEREKEPLGLAAKARVWYLVAREASATRVFRVARIQEGAGGRGPCSPSPAHGRGGWGVRAVKPAPR